MNFCYFSLLTATIQLMNSTEKERERELQREQPLTNETPMEKRARELANFYIQHVFDTVKAQGD